MIKANRDEFLEQGFVVLRRVIPPGDLDELRRSHELLVKRQREVWALNAGPDDPPGGVWETGAQPRLITSNMGDQHDKNTASTVELWLHENIQGVSSYLLAEDDVPNTEMMMMCNPTTNRGPAAWHRDFYPPLNAPLMAYADDIVENGPRYVQWNIPLYDDNVLQVIPGSHVRRNTEEENKSMESDPRAPVPGCVQPQLNAGDAVAYILPILHWGSNYSTRKRRTIHGGFARLTHYEDTSWIQNLSSSAQDTFLRWHNRAAKYMDYAESAFRGVLEKDEMAYRAALDVLHPGRGEKGVIKSTICLSKTAKHIYNQQCCDLNSLTEKEKSWMQMVHPMTLQWGLPFGEKFTPEEAQLLWDRFKPIDDLVQTAEENSLPGFQGKETTYLFEDVPEELTMKNWLSSWEIGKLRR